MLLSESLFVGTPFDLEFCCPAFGEFMQIYVSLKHHFSEIPSVWTELLRDGLECRVGLG
jgi:hypothetical protein